VQDGAVLPRRAVDADLAELLVLIAEFYAVDRHPFDRERVLRGLRPLLADDRFGQVWLVDPTDTTDTSGAPDGPPAAGPAGYAVVTWSWSLESGGRDCILDELYVRDRGSGVGTRLLREVLAAAVAAGAGTVFLETEAHNARVRGFYARLGFATEDSVWMRRTLP
jgi:GNAT superfamily N-acetyltransferase